MAPQIENTPPANNMNRTRVIVWMTVAVFLVFSFVMVAVVGGIPPWPVWLWFIVSHAFFCVVISKVKPYTGPYVEPMTDPDLTKPFE